MSKLADVFKNHKVFIPFIVADDPDFETTVKNVVALAKGGADIVELGIVFKYGYDAFLKRCADLNVAGLVIPDLPYESRDEIVPIAEKYGIDIIPLITPTSGHRIEKIAKSASGFIYVVSSMGITGERDEFFAGLKALVAEIKQYTNVPTAIGFGIHTPEQAQTMAGIADGVIIGSAIVDLVAKEKQQAPAAIEKFTKQIRVAVDAKKQISVK